MKEDIITDRDDEIQPLTIAAIEEEQLGVWLSDDDNDGDGVNGNQAERHLYFGNEVTATDEEAPPVALNSISLTMEEGERLQALLDLLMQDFLSRWEILDDADGEQEDIIFNQLVEHNSAGEPENVFFDQFMPNNEVGEHGNMIFDLRVFKDEAGEQEDMSYDINVADNEAGEQDDIISNRLVENNEAEEDQAADDENLEA